MFSTDAMSYGIVSFPFPHAADFPWIYPTGCGYQSSGTQISFDGGGILVYILDGKGQARCGEMAGDYDAGCFLTAERASALTLLPAVKTEYLYLLLRNAAPLFTRLGESGFIQIPAAGSRADRLLGRICYNAQTHLEQNIYTASADAYTLFMELCAACEAPDAAYSPLIRQAIELMREEYAFLAGVDELAERLGVTKSHLIRSFTAAAGVSPGRYLQTVKLDNAKLMLQNRDYTIEMVADMVGYAGANYFCKVFRRATGESPGAYRARHLAPPDAAAKRRIAELEGVYHL